MMSDVLTQPKFMTQRERLITDYCTFLLRQHALKHGVSILLNTPEIDEQGYDITVEHKFDYVPIQLKTKSIKATTDRWCISADFFNANFYDQIRLNLLVDGEYIGLHGGGGVVILQEFDEHVLSEFVGHVKYYICDVFYVLSVAKGFRSARNFTRDDALTLLRAVRSAGSGRFEIPRSAFLPVTSPAAVLDWRLNVADMCNHKFVCGFEEQNLRDDAPPLKMLRWNRSRYIPSECADAFPSFRPSYDAS